MEREKSWSFLPPWEFQTPLPLGTPGLIINLPKNWLSQEQRGSAIRILVSILPQTPLPFRLPQSIEQSSLCYTVDPCWSSISNRAAVHVDPEHPNYPFPHREGCFNLLLCVLYLTCPVPSPALISRQARELDIYPKDQETAVLLRLQKQAPGSGPSTLKQVHLFLLF